MKRVLVLILIANVGYGQLPDTAKYNLDDVIKITVRKNKNATAGTKEIISGIAQQYDGEGEQLEMIRFYKRVFDYKVVDKKVLNDLIDSISEYGVTEKVKRTAIETRTFIEHRFLGKKIKDFEFPDRDGKLIKLSSLNDRIVIIELWATWCGPCVREMAKIPELRSKNKDIEFYSISLDRYVEKMKYFIAKNKYDWPIVFGGYADANKELWDYLNIVAVPKYYTVDRTGTVINIADNLDVEFVRGLK